MRARILAFIAIASALAGCQAFAPSSTPTRSVSTSTDGTAQLPILLNGDFDNHEQTLHAGAAPALPVPHVHHTLRVVEQDRVNTYLLWTLQSGGDKGITATWLYRLTETGKQIVLTPYRAVSNATLQELADSKHAFKFQDDQWAPLDVCTQSGTWNNGKFSSAANAETCSGLLPGLGASAALLPLKLTIESDAIRVQTFADLARGADAVEEARRVRWFTGWTAVNGGGPSAKSANQDWHLRDDTRLSTEGGRSTIRWRDGAASGYTLELERRMYPERKLSVLQLNVIEDASGKVLTYAWTDPGSASIGLNMGWLQIGLTELKANSEGARP